jgi:4-carboxymuconolactone decarboxylase
MAERPAHPRIPPIGPDDYDDEVNILLKDVQSPGVPAHNVFTTMVRNRGLFRKWMPFGAKLLAGKLAGRDRELAILRVGWRCQAQYEWGQHVLAARRAGLTDDEIGRVKAGPEASGWSAGDAAILRAVDELHDDACVTDATWAELRQVYTDAQLIELVFLIGEYHLVSFALNSLGVQRDEGVPGLDGP